MASSVDVSLMPFAPAPADVSVVVDCVRATTVVAHALAAGYRRVVCVAEIEHARVIAAATEDSVLGGERDAVRIDGFQLGNSPAEYDTAQGETLVLCTTNGTRAVIASAPQSGTLFCGALVNLEAVANAVAGAARRVVICCAGVEGRPALDDAYTAGRYVQRLIELQPEREPTDAAAIALSTAERFPTARAALEASSSARRLRAAGLGADLEACAHVSALDVVPALVARGRNRVELAPAARAS